MVLWLRQGISKTPSPRHFREGLHGKGSKGSKSSYRHSIDIHGAYLNMILETLKESYLNMILVCPHKAIKQ